MIDENLRKRIDFIVEVDKLKSIYRQTSLIDKSRNEGDAEHSWHLALMAIILVDYTKDVEIDLLKILKMVIIHDIVEIDAGDTFCYDANGHLDKREREEMAANRIFGILPINQKKELFDLWIEFEEMNTFEAKFASALDRLQPLLNNYFTKGSSWKKHGIKASQVIKRNEHIKDSTPLLWSFVEDIIEDSVNKGYLKKE